MLQRIILFW